LESYLLDSERSKVIREMNETYTEFNYKETKKNLEGLASSLEHKYLVEASSLDEGLDEILTLHRLKVPGLLRISFLTTNLIELARETARDIMGRVRGWSKGNQVLRWLSCVFYTRETV